MHDHLHHNFLILLQLLVMIDQKKAGDSYKFSYEFRVFNYKFQFQITFTYANAKVNYELTNFEVAKVT